MFPQLGIIVASLLAAKADGQPIGLLASKTQWGATTGSLTGLCALLPRIAAKDPEAIGLAVLIVGAWLFTLYGRLAKETPKSEQA